MKNLIFKIGLFLFIFNLTLPLHAQSSDTDQGFDMTGLPQWTRDLRRGEIIAFGSFPFTLLFSQFFMNTYRSATHDWDTRYAPWPFTAPGAVNMTQEEHLLTLGFAVGGSILIAVVDHFIFRYRRNKQEQEIRSLPTGTPIIIRYPIDGEQGGGEDSPGDSPDRESETS